MLTGAGWPANIPNGNRRTAVGSFIAPDLPEIRSLAAGTSSIRPQPEPRVKLSERSLWGLEPLAQRLAGLLPGDQGSGNIVLVDLNTNEIIGRINAALNPRSARAGASFALTVTGTNLAGATELVFIDPDSLPGRGKGKGREEHGNHGHGPFGKRDPGFTVTNITVNPAGTQLTATVAIAASVARGDRLVRVNTPNGESTFKESGNNTFKVE
ncbi:MAG: hypothetical protein AAB225_12675 [Acidobacteriota bacterium]